MTKVKFTIPTSIDKQNENGTIYTKEAIENAINNIHTNIPKKLLRPIRIGAGDYMGSGYAFTDKFNKIYDEFTYNCSEELWQKIRIALDSKLQKSNFILR